MKTLFLYDTTTEEARFFELEGDYSRLDGVYINSDSTEEQVEELNKILFNEDWTYKVEFLKEPTKDWDFFVHVGFNE